MRRRRYRCKTQQYQQSSIARATSLSQSLGNDLRESQGQQSSNAWRLQRRHPTDHEKSLYRHDCRMGRGRGFAFHDGWMRTPARHIQVSTPGRFVTLGRYNLSEVRVGLRGNREGSGRASEGSVVDDPLRTQRVDGPRPQTLLFRNLCILCR